jgi:Ca-activated chloride channel family protein
MLLGLALVPLLVWAYWYGLFAGAEARRAARRGRARVDRAYTARARRHIPFALVTGIALVARLARPTVNVAVPGRGHRDRLRRRSGVLAKDLNPTRIDAAKVAARAFVAGQPGRSRSAWYASVTAPSSYRRATTSKR